MLGLIITVIIVYLFYYIWIVFNFDRDGKQKKRKKKKKESVKEIKKKMPAEIQFFVSRYNIDLEKINYRYFLQFMGLVIAFDFGIVISIVAFIKVLLLQIVVGIVLVIIATLVSFKLAGNYFKTKGLIKDETNTRNRKKVE